MEEESDGRAGSHLDVSSGCVVLWAQLGRRRQQVENNAQESSCKTVDSCPSIIFVS